MSAPDTLIPLLFSLPFFLAGYFLWVRAYRENFFAIVAGRHSAPAQIIDVTPAAKDGTCRIRFRFQSNTSGQYITTWQRTTASAIVRAGLMSGSTAEVCFQRKFLVFAFLPALIRAERTLSASQGSATESSDTRSAPTLVYVKFTAPNAKKWQENGDALVYDEAVFFTARRPRPFRNPKRVQTRVPMDRIVNVERHSKSIRLAIADPGDAPMSIQFDTVSEDEARKLEQLLPTRRTETFTPILAEQGAFNDALLLVSPTAWVTPALVGVNAFIFTVTSMLGGGFFRAKAETMIRFGTDFTPLTVNGQWWRLFTSIFLHFGFMHLALNMWALYVNGIVAERIFGSRRYLTIYLVAGVFGSVASLLWHPMVNGAGASGAIFGIFGALIAFFLKKEGGVPRSVIKAQLQSVSIFVFYNLAFAAGHRGIDNAAHLGGLAAGFAMGFLLSRPLEPTRDNRNWAWQWVGALGVVVGSGLLFARLWHTGVLALRADPTRIEERRSIPGVGPILREFGGVKLDSTAAEVLAQKGPPLARVGGHWTYNAIDDRRDGLITVYFTAPGKDDIERVRLVTFIGHDKDAAPKELPYLNSSTLRDVAKLYGDPVTTRDETSGISFNWYKNGVFATAGNEKVIEYGISRVKSDDP